MIHLIGLVSIKCQFLSLWCLSVVLPPAGSMLAHLHTLQTENRQMQSRIMELASQREFYLAINTKLRQTISEHDLGECGVGAVIIHGRKY